MTALGRPLKRAAERLVHVLPETSPPRAFVLREFVDPLRVAHARQVGILLPVSQNLHGSRAIERAGIDACLHCRQIGARRNAFARHTKGKASFPLSPSYRSALRAPRSPWLPSLTLRVAMLAIGPRVPTSAGERQTPDAKQDYRQWFENGWDRGIAVGEVHKREEKDSEEYRKGATDCRERDA